MSELMQASHQWATRPADQRFTSLTQMQKHFHAVREASHAIVRASRKIEAMPTPDNAGLLVSVQGEDVDMLAPTNWSFGQLAQIAEAPASYLRSLASPLAADCINYGLKVKRSVEDVGLLYHKNGGPAQLRAATGPKYGRIWNADILDKLVLRFGDGLSGDWRVPGEFGKRVDVTAGNTTLYASDRDCFIFLADEDHRIEIPNRRNGETGTLARGFFLWNSEEGKSSFGLSTFLFDYACCNRIVWGAREYAEVIIRHTSGAPDRFIEEIQPALKRYAESSTASVVHAIEDARKAKLQDDVDTFLANRYGKRMVQVLKDVHDAEEKRPIETRWDVVTAVTAYARSIEQTDRRIELEKDAGELLTA